VRHCLSIPLVPVVWSVDFKNYHISELYSTKSPMAIPSEYKRAQQTPETRSLPLLALQLSGDKQDLPKIFNTN